MNREAVDSHIAITSNIACVKNTVERAEDGLHNFEKALGRLCEVVGNKEFFENKEMADVYADVVIKRFEFTFEMSWKAIKRVLAMLGLEELRNPRQCFKAAFSQGYIADEII